MSLLVVSTVLLQIAAGVPRRSQTRHSGSDKSIDWSSAMVESTMRRYSTAKDLGSPKKGATDLASEATGYIMGEFPG